MEVVVRVQFIVGGGVGPLIHFEELIVPSERCFDGIDILGIERIEKRILESEKDED